MLVCLIIIIIDYIIFQNQAQLYTPMMVACKHGQHRVVSLILEELHNFPALYESVLLKPTVPPPPSPPSPVVMSPHQDPAGIVAVQVEHTTVHIHIYICISFSYKHILFTTDAVLSHDDCL